MAIQGLRTTANFVSNQAPENWREGIMLSYPNGKMVLTALTSMMKSRSVDDFRFHWWEKEADNRTVALGASITTGATTFTLTSGAKKFKRRDVLWSPQTDERFLVAADPSSDTVLQVTRGFEGTTPTAITYNGAGVNPNLIGIGSAFEEGSSAPTGVSLDPTEKVNYTGIFRDTLEATRTAIKTRLRTGEAVREAKRECLELHGMGIERALWLGKKVSTTLDGKPHHTTDGVFQFIDSNNVKTVTSDYGSGLTMAGLEEYMYNAFKYGSSEKLGVCGNRALLTIQQIIRKNTTWQIQQGLKEAGMNVSRLISPFGEIVLKSHPLWNQMAGGTTGGTAYYGMESWLAILDMEEFSYVYLKDSDTQYEPKLQDNGLDGMKSGYITECGLEVHHPKHHYLLKNLVLAAADS